MSPCQTVCIGSLKLFIRQELPGHGHLHPVTVGIFLFFHVEGEIDGARGIRILNDYTLAFFNRYLLGSESQNIEDIAQKYAEVTLESN